MGDAPILGLIIALAIGIFLLFVWYVIRPKAKIKKDEPRASENLATLEATRQEVNNGLKSSSSIFLGFCIILLILLGLLGWNGVEKSIDFAVRTPTPVATQPATAIDASPEAATPIGTPVPAWPSDKDLRSMATTQHYASLVLVAGLLVLLPILLLVAFAFQRVPRLSKDLLLDLIKLGIFKPEVSIEEQQESNARKELEDELTRRASSLSPENRTKLVTDLMNPLLLPDEMEDKIREKVPDISQDDLNWLIDIGWYSHTTSLGDDPPSFGELLSSRFGASEFIIPLIPLSLFVLASLIWIFFPGGIPTFVIDTTDFNTYINSKITSILPALAGVVSAYIFLIYTLVRRNNSSDLTPGTFWEALRRLITVFGLGLILTAFQPEAPTPSDSSSLGIAVQQGIQATLYFGLNSGLILLALFLGIFPTAALKTFARYGQIMAEALMGGIIHAFFPNSKLPGGGPDLSLRLSPRHELYLLDDLDEWDALRLEEANIVGLQGMATADLAHLLLWTPFPTSQVLDWVDQAMLFLSSGAEPETSFAKTFRTIGLRRASTLMDMCKDEPGKQTVLLAARAVQASGVFDPLPVAQLAAMRAQLLIKDMQEKVVKVKDKTTSDGLDANLRSEIEAAISLVRNAKSLADQAYEQVKSGGDLLKKVLTNEADKLHIMLETAAAKATEVETALKAITGTDPKVSDGLANSLKALGDQVTSGTDANQRVQDLVAELNRIANPLTESLEKARECLKKAEEIQKAAEEKKTEVPASVNEAADLLTTLTDLATKGKERILADSSLEAAKTASQELVDELKTDGDDKAVKLLSDDKLKKKNQWTEEGVDKKAKCYPDAEKLVKHAQAILKKAETAEGLVKKARAEMAISTAPVPLTLEVLETILAGLRGNANLKRIQLYIDAENKSVEADPG
jgi:hypothetical protein